jgi:hypothetical protein
LRCTLVYSLPPAFRRSAQQKKGSNKAMRALAIFLGAMMLAACVAQPPKVADTKWPQVIIKAQKSELRERILAAFAAKGAAIDDSGESLIQARIPDENAAMSKAFFGCGLCADPYIKLNVVLSAIADGTQVVIQYWRVIPKPNGSEERMEITSNTDFNQAQQMLWTLRDQYAKAP